jgi:hypothetical protein
MACYVLDERMGSMRPRSLASLHSEHSQASRFRTVSRLSRSLGDLVRRDGFRGFEIDWAAPPIRLRPVSSYVKASDYYMNYYTRRPRFTWQVQSAQVLRRGLDKLIHNPVARVSQERWFGEQLAAG